MRAMCLPMWLLARMGRLGVVSFDAFYIHRYSSLTAWRTLMRPQRFNLLNTGDLRCSIYYLICSGRYPYDIYGFPIVWLKRPLPYLVGTWNPEFPVRCKGDFTMFTLRIIGVGVFGICLRMYLQYPWGNICGFEVPIPFYVVETHGIVFLLISANLERLR